MRRLGEKCKNIPLKKRCTPLWKPHDTPKQYWEKFLKGDILSDNVILLLVGYLFSLQDRTSVIHPSNIFFVCRSYWTTASSGLTGMGILSTSFENWLFLYCACVSPQGDLVFRGNPPHRVVALGSRQRPWTSSTRRRKHDLKATMMNGKD